MRKQIGSRCQRQPMLMPAKPAADAKKPRLMLEQNSSEDAVPKADADAKAN
jgi:hypothetical protein